MCLLLLAGRADAAPIGDSITGGSVDIDVKLDGVVIGTSAGVALTGDSIMMDTAALTLNALRIEIAPTLISLSTHFGGFDEISVESAIIEGDITFANLWSQDTGTPGLFSVGAGPLLVTGSWGATDSTGINAGTSGQPITFPVPTITGIIDASPGLRIDSVTMHSIEGTPFGEAGKHLTIVASYSIETEVSIVPEPGTGLLVAMGLTALAWHRRSGSGAGPAPRG